MPISNDSKRLIIRDNIANFTVTFYSDAAMTVPVTPIDANVYPGYSIYDIEDNVVQTGTGQPETTPGQYKAIWQVPKDALLSNDLKRWRIEWVMVGDDHRQFDFVEEFDVIDRVITASESREQKFITFAGQDTRMFIRLGYEPAEVAMDLYKFGQDVRQIGVTYPGDIVMAPDGDSLVYYYDIPGNQVAKNTKYTILWKLRTTLIDPYEFLYQNLISISPHLMDVAVSLRMLIDKLQKRLSTAQAYEDSDIIEYLEKGHQMVNSFGPPTNYAFGNVPPEFNVYIVLFAAWWAINAQILLETDLAFSFCLDENTLIPTGAGLARIRDYSVPATLGRELLALTVNEDKMAILDQILDMDFDNQWVRLSDIATELDVELLSLANLFGKLNITKYKKRNEDHWLWDMSGVQTHLNNILEPCRLSTASIYTPGGNTTVQSTYHFTKRPVIRIYNKIGYPITVTPEHQILTLSPDFSMTWKRADQINTNDLIAINMSPGGFGEDDNLEYYVNLVRSTVGPTHSECVLPTAMTPELARILGYLLAEGDVCSKHSIRFYNTDQEILNDYYDCVRSVFNIEPSVITKPNPGNLTSNDITHIDINSVAIRKFLYALGMKYSRADKKQIPDIMLRQSKSLTAEFVKAYVEGDGCVSVHHKDYGSALQAVIISSASHRLLWDFQSLFLQYGILTTLNDTTRVGRLVLSGQQFHMYRSEIGLMFKGINTVVEKSKFANQREAMPEVLSMIKNGIKERLGLAKYESPKIDGVRVGISWQHSAKGSKHIRKSHLLNWWADRKETIKALDEELHSNIELFMNQPFVWKPVTRIEDAGVANVIDISVPAMGDIPHSIISDGIITHNSGQTVTLDYDHTGALSDWAGRVNEYISTTLPQVKLTAVRRRTATGAVAGRAYRWMGLNNIVYKIGSNTGGNSILNTLSHVGLLF